MSPEHKRFLLLEQGIGAAVFNLALNAAIAWLLFRQFSEVPLWGQLSIAGDTFGTCFFLPFFTALIVTPLVRRRMRRGGLAAVELDGPLGALTRSLPRRTLSCALALGVACALVIGPVAVWTCDRLSIAPLQLWPFVTLKAVFAATLAAVMTPLISLRALASAR